MQSKPKTLAVRVARTVVLETREEYAVLDSTHFGEQVKEAMLLSPTKDFVEKHKVLVARAVVGAQPLKAPLHL